MQLKFILSLIAVLVVGAVAFGCGGSSSDSGSTGSSGAETRSTGGGSEGGEDGTTQNASGNGAGGAPLTKAAFIKQGDKICGEIPAEYEKLRQKLLKSPEKNEASTAKVNEVAAIPPVLTAVESFEELTPPKGEEAAAEAIVDALEAAGKGLEEEPAAPLVGPKSPYAEFQKLTKEYGFQFCKEL
jgi:hypothetical protein